MARLIALYGGSFDPIHFGHLIAARGVAETLGLEQVVFLPSAHPPHKGAVGLADVADRANMVKLAIEGERLFAFSDFDLRTDGPTYTIDTVAHFSEQLGDAVIHFIIGADSLVELATWRRVEMLVERCRIVTAARPGWEQPDLSVLRSKLSDAQIDRLRGGIVGTPRIDISATEIRARVRAGRSIRYLVPEAVCSYIADHGLYRNGDA